MVFLHKNQNIIDNNGLKSTRIQNQALIIDNNMTLVPVLQKFRKKLILFN